MADTSRKSELKHMGQVLEGGPYDIGPSQRPYAWLEEALAFFNTNYSVFDSSYKEGDPAEARQNYDIGWSGSIEFNLEHGRLTLTDGQQRLTTLFILLIILMELQDDTCRTDLSRYLYTENVSGDMTLRINGRYHSNALTALIKGEKFELTNKSHPTEKSIIAVYNLLKKNMPRDLHGEKLKAYTLWLLHLVHVSVISHGEGVSAAKTFKDSNSGGKPLTGAERFNSSMFSFIPPSDKRDEVHDIIQKAQIDITNLGGKHYETVEKFLTSLIQAKKAKDWGTVSKCDFDMCVKSPDMWLEKFGPNFGMDNEQGMIDFVTEEYAHLAESYIDFVNYAQNYNSTMKHVFEADKSGFPYLASLVLAPIVKSDSKYTRNNKMNVVCYFASRMRIFQTWNGDTRTTDSLRGEVLEIIKIIRDKPLDELVEELIRITGSKPYLSSLNEVAPMYSNGNKNNKNLTFMVGMLTEKVETCSGKSSIFVNNFPTRKTFNGEAEHVASNKHVYSVEDFETAEEFQYIRNQVGAIGLVEKTFNASFGALDYGKKITRYSQHNILLASLDIGLYDENGNIQNNKKLADLEAAAGVKFKAYNSFSKTMVSERNKLYRGLIAYLFNIENLYSIAGLEKPESETVIVLDILGSADDANIVEVNVDMPMVFA